MNKLRSFYWLLLDLIYIITVYLKYISGKKIVFYSKKHPIFTVCFEDNPPEGFVFFYPVKSKILAAFNLWIEKKTSIYHLDAAAFFKPDNSKPLIVECEAIPSDKLLADPQIKKIFVESLSAGRAHLGQDKVELLYPSIQPQKYITKPENEYVTILTVGFGSMVKGYDVLYRIYNELKKEYKIKLIVAGAFGHDFTTYPEVSYEAYERADFDTIIEAFKSDPNVTLSPYSRNNLLAHVYPKADIYIQLCRMETFGFSILEAMSFGLPVIAPYFKAIPEMIEHGKNGFLISSMQFDKAANDYSININSKEWADLCRQESEEYLKELLNSRELREKMGAASLQKVTDKFNVKVKSIKLQTIYSELIKG